MQCFSMGNPDDVQTPQVEEPPRILGTQQRARIRSQMGKAIGTIQAIAGPALIKRAASNLESDDLNPVEREVRAIRQDFLSDIENPTVGQRALVDAATLDIIIMSSCQKYILALCEGDGLINRRFHNLYPVILQYTKIAKAAQSRLKLLGFKREQRKPTAIIDDYVRQWRASQSLPKESVSPGDKPKSDLLAKDTGARSPKAKAPRAPKGKLTKVVPAVGLPDSSNSENLPSEEIQPPPNS